MDRSFIDIQNQIVFKVNKQLKSKFKNDLLFLRMNGPILSADFGYLRVTIFGTKFQTGVPMY